MADEPEPPNDPPGPQPPPDPPPQPAMPELQQVQLYLLTLLRQLPATGPERTAITDAMDVIAAHPFLPEPTTTH
jgi:hypothetical protein